MGMWGRKWEMRKRDSCSGLIFMWEGGNKVESSGKLYFLERSGFCLFFSGFSVFFDYSNGYD